MNDNAEVLTDAVDAAIVTEKQVDAVEAPQVEGQDDTPPAVDSEQDKAEKSEAAKRRERDRAYKERLRTEAAEAQAQLRKVAEQKAKIIAAANSEVEPTEKDFPDAIDLITAKSVWAMRKASRTDQLAALEEQEQTAQYAYQDRVNKEQAAILANWSDQVNSARERYADFDKVVLSEDGAKVTNPAIARLIQTADSPADLAYHVCLNPQLVAQLDQMHPVEAARVLGRIEAQLQAPKPRKTSTAPEPINPTNGGGSVGIKDPAKMEGKEYSAYVNGGGKI